MTLKINKLMHDIVNVIFSNSMEVSIMSIQTDSGDIVNFSI